MQNSDIMTRNNSLYGSQTSPVVLSMQYNVINILGEVWTHRDFFSGPKVAVLHAKTTDEGWDP